MEGSIERPILRATSPYGEIQHRSWPLADDENFNHSEHSQECNDPYGTVCPALLLLCAQHRDPSGGIRDHEIEVGQQSEQASGKKQMHSRESETNQQEPVRGRKLDPISAPKNERQQ